MEEQSTLTKQEKYIHRHKSNSKYFLPGTSVIWCVLDTNASVSSYKYSVEK